MTGIAVIGCGGIGRARARSTKLVEGANLVVVCDVDEQRAQQTAKDFDCEASTDWEKVVQRHDVDLVIVSALNSLHAPISIAAMEAGKDVICEKPLARNPEEAQRMVETAERTGRLLKTGFNHRFHPTVMKARELLDAGYIGDPVFLRGRTGHRGGDVFANKRWFLDKEQSGGGTFLDNGVHLLDLARWFMGDFKQATGYVATNIWKDIAPCEDNGFGLFRTADDRIASIHSSWTQWRSYLYFELHGTQGFITVDYEANTVRLVRRLPDEGQLFEQTFQFNRDPDMTWARELKEMLNAMKERRQPLASGYDGWQAVRMAYAVYDASASGCATEL